MARAMLMAEDERVPVIIVQKQGSPGTVHTDLEAALAEVRELLTVMLADEAPPERIELRTGTMGRAWFADLAEFSGY